LRPLQDYRKVYKLYTTYVRPLRNLYSVGLDKKQRAADPHLCFDNCIHAEFLLTGTRSGRLNCKNPNLQQLPRDGVVKSMFTSRFGKRGCIYQADLSQIELRILAAVSGDATMVDAYFKDTDLHSLTASRIFNVPYEHFLKDYADGLRKKGQEDQAKDLETKRHIAKTINFLTSYGGGAFGLQNVLAAKSIYRSIEECRRVIDAFFDSYPTLRKFLQHYRRFILETQQAVSIFGRVRILEEAKSADEEIVSKALRMGCNHLIQATASDMMLLGLVAIEQLMRQANLESLLVSTVHDSLVIDSVCEELPEVHGITTDVLNNLPLVFKALFGEHYDDSWMTVPFTVDAECGKNYLSMFKLPNDNKVGWDKVYVDLKE
jgi:DNA polymerase-1